MAGITYLASSSLFMFYTSLLLTHYFWPCEGIEIISSPYTYNKSLAYHFNDFLQNSNRTITYWVSLLKEMWMGLHKCFLWSLGPPGGYKLNMTDRRTSMTKNVEYAGRWAIHEAFLHKTSATDANVTRFDTLGLWHTWSMICELVTLSPNLHKFAYAKKELFLLLGIRYFWMQI